MTGFLVSSGGFDKEVSKKHPKEAALVALKKWSHSDCLLGLVTIVTDENAEATYFFTLSLLEELGFSCKEAEKKIGKTCFHCQHESSNCKKCKVCKVNCSGNAKLCICENFKQAE